MGIMVTHVKMVSNSLHYPTYARLIHYINNKHFLNYIFIF
jgi:hypothetical protein